MPEMKWLNPAGGCTCESVVLKQYTMVQLYCANMGFGALYSCKVYIQMYPFPVNRFRRMTISSFAMHVFSKCLWMKTSPWFMVPPSYTLNITQTNRSLRIRGFSNAFLVSITIRKGLGGKGRHAVSPSKHDKTVPVIGLFPVPTSFKVKETI